eukprot:2570766-Heterocapsa_arctica.AAC.1
MTKRYSLTSNWYSSGTTIPNGSPPLKSTSGSQSLLAGGDVVGLGGLGGQNLVRQGGLGGLGGQ